MSDNIKVVVKVRPLISREIEEKLSYQWRVKNNTLYQLDQNGKDFGTAFTFDKVYDKDTKTSDVYDDIAKPIVEAAAAGFNGTIFAYGQTSSGKTYTMTGTEQSPGIIPLAVLNLFEIIKNVPDRDFLVRVSYIEIYNETLKDLLNVEKENIKIHESLQGIKVDATEKVATSPEEVLDAMKQGEANRQTGATNMNEKSSRSHSIFQITIESREHMEDSDGGEAGCVNVSQLNLVDLAGSERAGQTGATGLRFKEGTHINKSLSALALVIKQLSEDPNKYANYRDSKLTRILQNSLGGNAKTSIICAVTPAAIEETISTLQFANRAKAIKNKPEVNAVATDATMIQSLTKQLSKLQAQLENKKRLEVILEKKKHVEQDNYNLQKQIAALQKLILNSFGQRSSAEMMGQRRKQPNRRITISTLHSIEEDTPPPPVPRFCTPALKYNPMTVAGASELVPIPSRSTLSSLPEEPPRLVTPPPHGKKVSFEGEVIELDSDDDDCSSTQVCSPYHGCRDKSKTPPCILRKNAKLAEKNLKDIIQFTEREKIYTPSVVELIEKLEQNSAVISRLQDEIEVLNKHSKEKDFEMDQLKNKIKKSEENIKNVTSAKADLEEKCKDFVIKVTDCEVSYESLQKKYKLREQELLSLLEEQKVPKSDKCKSCSKTTLNELGISKLENISDTESNFTDTETSSANLNSLVSSLQEELLSKNQTIVELEANLCAQQQKIVFLENSSQELEGLVLNIRKNLAFVEEENTLLKSTVDTLNSTIKSQKANLETANDDKKSYDSLIQELQTQLMNKDNLSSVNINDSLLENMVANEEKFIANNENIKNVIHSFKLALENRDKEINQLKTALESNMQGNGDNECIKENLEAKTKQIYDLNEEVRKLQDQIKDNITTINKLVREKNNFATVEQDLAMKISTIEEHNTQLEKTNQESLDILKTLEEQNNQLTLQLKNINAKEQTVLKNNIDLAKETEELRNKITQLEKDLHIKDDFVASLQKEEQDTQEYIEKAQLAIQKLKNILVMLTGNVQDVPEVIDNFVNIFSVLSSSLNILEIVVAETVSKRNSALETIAALNKELDELRSNNDSEIKDIIVQLETLKDSEKCLLIEISEMKDKLTTVIEEKSNIEIALHDCQNSCTSLQNDLSSKEQLVSLLQENQCKLVDEKQELIIQITSLSETISKINGSLNNKQDNFDHILLDKEKDIEKLTKTIEKMSLTLEDKSNDISLLNNKLQETQNDMDIKISTVSQKVANLLESLNIESDISHEIKDKNKDNCNTIISALDKISNHITSHLKDKNHQDHNSTSQVLIDIEMLREQNTKLTEYVKEIEHKNSELINEMEIIQKDNRSLNENLIGSGELLEQLRYDLKMKRDEIQIMENKVREWKKQFEELDNVTKEQMYELRLDNDLLKSRYGNSSDNGYHEDEFSDLGLGHSNFVDDNSISKSPSNDLKEMRYSPKSLVTICCSQIIDNIHPKDNAKSVTPSSSKTDVEVQNTESQVNICDCNQLKLELSTTQNENMKLIEIVEQMKFVNQQLTDDRDEVRKEINLLLEPVQELQKKVVNHKTNLSILTATTYAENKSLKSQVKSLQHHHSRFHNVCQRDIPAIKKQLCELFTILKGNATLSDAHNISFKRYSLPDVLDNNTSVCNLRNESTLDGDLLMLDTNVTLTTADNTLVGCDQTCLDLTQMLYNEVSCQINEINKLNESNALCSQIELLNTDSQNMLESLEILKEENRKLRIQLDKYSTLKETHMESSKIEKDVPECDKCKNVEELTIAKENLERDFQEISKTVLQMKTEKKEIEQKYITLTLEVPSTEALVRKLAALEKDYNSKRTEIVKLTEALKSKTQQTKALQEENDSLSTQVFDNISEMDDLNKELNQLRQTNFELSKQCAELEKSIVKPMNNITALPTCSECILKDKFIQSIQRQEIKDSHSKLNKSLSDSETSSRYNKICTLQSELHAGREDCRVLSEDVTTIKHHLERSNISMDLDESMGDANIYSFPKDSVADSSQLNTCSMPDIPEERMLNAYMVEKIDCLNYYIEKMGIERENINCDIKIIDIMKMFYNNLVAKHGNEVENLLNKLKDYEESKIQLQLQILHINSEFSKIHKELEEKNCNMKKFADIISLIKNNIKSAETEISNPPEGDDIKKSFNIIKDNLLSVLDHEFGFSSVNLIHLFIDKLVTKQQNDLSEILGKYTMLQEQAETLTSELTSVNGNLGEMRRRLSEKETEYNLLKAQKDRIHEINNAVTLDIIRREQQLQEIVNSYYKQLLEFSIVKQSDIDLAQPLNVNLDILFSCLIKQHKCQVSNHEKEKIVKRLEDEKENLILEINNAKTVIETKNKQLIELKSLHNKLQEVAKNANLDLNEKNKQLEELKSIHEDLCSVYNKKVEENNTNLVLAEKLAEEVRVLKETVSQKEATIISLSKQDQKILEFHEKIKDLHNENANLKSINEMITKEKETYASELKKSGETINQNNHELDKMTSEILILRETIKESSLAIDTLKDEAQSLLKQNSELKQQFEQKARDCCRLETNMKTHEKTAEIQSRMIIRLQKQKEEDDKLINEKNKQVEEITAKCLALQKEYDSVQNQAQAAKHEIEELRNTKESLEARISELVAEAESGHKPRLSLESRRRRQSLHDSKRLFSEDKHEFEDGKTLETMFETRHKPDDLFMDVEEDYSNRSTPNRQSRGRDSLLSRTDQSEKDEEHPSRPSSVVETRRRRQSSHDLHRSVTRYTPSPHDHSKIDDALKQLESGDSVVSQLRQQLSACQLELEELRERYKDLDEECDTCAEYLRERDEQCARLKREKLALEKQVNELKKQTVSASPGGDTPSLVEVGVNTDEDWTKLHSLVVDRMSYDAEVEKNKKLSKTIEELRYKNQDLKMTLAKMQKALEKYSGKDNRELEATKEELEALKEELAELRQRNKELDEECDTCAEYLRERDEQNRRLKEAKAALETKLQEWEERSGARAHSRRKRQTMHDLNRSPAVDSVDLSDAATETTEDFLNSQVERDDSCRESTNDPHSREIKRLKAAVEKLSQQKAALEKQLVSNSHAPAHPTMYVATGSAIVQNQQLTDVMKENQKLKKINAKLINICKKRGKSEANRENEDPSNQ